MFDFLNVPLGWIIKVCYQLTNNYALALLLFALALQIILLPFGIKQQKNSIKQAKLDPKVRAIKKKYAGRTDQATQQKLQAETMELYQKEGFNPMGGCLPLLIQMPILLSLYNVVISPFKYICGFGQDVIKNIQNAVYKMMEAGGATADALKGFAENVTPRQIDLYTKMNELGIENFVGEGKPLTAEMAENLPNFSAFRMDLSQTPSFDKLNLLLLIPILTLIVTLGSTFITKKFTYNPNPEASNGASMKVMQFTMPLVSVWITFTVAGAVGLYWIFRNVLSVLERIILSKIMPVPRFTEADYKAAEKEMNVKPQKKKNKTKVRSLHRIDEEDEDEVLEEKAPAPEKKPAVKEDAPKLKDESDRHKKEEPEEEKTADVADEEKSEQ